MQSSFVPQFLNQLADAGRELILRRSGGTDTLGDLRSLCDGLLSQKGEALGTALAREVVNAYSGLDKEGKLGFFRLLRDEFGPPQDAVERAIEIYQATPGPAELLALSRTLETPRQRLIRALNMAPGGTQAVVDMRQDLLDLLNHEIDLALVDADFIHLLTSWFNRGFLHLERIDWQTPAHILEKLINYESVHAIQGWEDLRRRLQDDRRCFAFFHPALVDEPLIFVEVALVNGLAAAIQPLLDRVTPPQNPGTADSAIFYSINNCQAGLRGISFGHFLIRQVVVELAAELPNIKQFATLSPVPGFGQWLQRLRSDGDGETGASDLAGSELREDSLQQLDDLAQTDWSGDEAAAEALKKPLLYLCAHYLLEVKNDDGRPLDPVARFHLGNGASLERINWLGDTSENGLRQSQGILVNYLYDLKKTVENHEAYQNEGRIACAKAVRRHLTVKF